MKKILLIALLSIGAAGVGIAAVTATNSTAEVESGKAVVAPLKAPETDTDAVQFTEAEQQVVKQLEMVTRSKVVALQSSAIDGFYEAITDQGIFYVSKDGQLLISGKLYRLGDEPANLTETAYERMRVRELHKLEDSMLVYPAKDEKYVIDVFTDVDCGYCRKLHHRMAEYNAKGITVRYLAFPRGGQRAPAFSTMQSIWCAEDPKLAMDQAKNGAAISSHSCDDPVAKHYAVGNQLGVSGTPAVFLDDGTKVGGFIEPDQLAQILAYRDAQQQKASN